MSADGNVDMPEDKNMSQNTEYVYLDVGGKLFTTCKSTLMSQHTMLATMFSDRWNKNKDGYVPIDRDGKHFDKILNFLRYGEISRPNSSEDLQEMIREADFYRISELSKCLEQYQKMEELGERSIFVNTRGNTNSIPVKVPLMADETLSLRVLRKIFKGAECLLRKGREDGTQCFVMLKMKGDQIFPPEGGWDYMDWDSYSPWNSWNCYFV